MKTAALIALLLAQPALAQLTASDDWAAAALTRHQVFPDITYVVANNHEVKLDVYERRDRQEPLPVMIYIHGGGWNHSSKETSVLSVLPWLQMGWNVVNVEYRLSMVSLAPAAAEDCLCALRWVAMNAKRYNFDTNRIVVSGPSAGGLLALTTGLIPPDAGLDRQCPGLPMPKVAAIINWFGITDVVDLLGGVNRRDYAVQWLGSAADREAMARSVSPLSYVRPGLPPILTIHGDADPTVPYSHALRLREALTKAGVPNQLVTVPQGKHGNFTTGQQLTAFKTVRTFLAEHGLHGVD